MWILVVLWRFLWKEFDFHLVGSDYPQKILVRFGVER